ncbi:hypothetical protein [Xylanimonas ulmi]|uniref:Uncharacterized protein n=1 Tax=Xylanimonas ulmi TaxID=228973 RepID=A0A4Q7M4D7_9MICO|nr:hypothetical protein [Xylanibacterium ulmi]RZS62231.1 hypothetical protein EV386_2555 [Xylanibacterium ulmi]
MIDDQHFRLYGKARSHLAALEALGAPEAYGWILLALDEMYEPDDLAPAVPLATTDRREIFSGAVDALTAIARLDNVDHLTLMLLVADLEDAWALESGRR